MMAGMYSPEKTGHGVRMHAMRCPRKPHDGYPLGGGHPERVLQEFCDAFHSMREDKSDMVPDYESETEEEWDDIVTYDTETCRCTMVAEQDHCIACDHHRTNKQRHCEWRL